MPQDLPAWAPAAAAACLIGGAAVAYGSLRSSQQSVLSLETEISRLQNENRALKNECRTSPDAARTSNASPQPAAAASGTNPSNSRASPNKPAGPCPTGPADPELETGYSDTSDATSTIDTSARVPDSIAILDFGSQFSHLIARRVREMHVFCELFSCQVDLAKLKELPNLKGIILSGGPHSVYDEGTCLPSTTVCPQLFALN